MTKVLPPQFLGRFKLVDSENFNEYLATKGLPWPARKLLEKCSFTKVIEPSDEPGRYNLHAIIPVKTTVFKKWALEEWFDATGFDGKKRQVSLYS
ncbi:CBN-LBP-4 protein [Aphelenchoides avenae]|nr:CBN-LBP-4 protein [Aphelenchus avenae]